MVGRSSLAHGLACVVAALAMVLGLTPARAHAIGQLTPIGCLENPGGTDCTGSGGTTQGLAGASAVAVTRDGNNVYVASQLSSAVVWLARGANGSLAAIGCVSNPVSDTDCSGSGGTAPGLSQPAGIAVSPDGKNVYVASSVPGAIAVFARAANGALTFQQCFEETGGTDCNASGGTAPGLKGARGIAVSPDGRNVYVASVGSNAIAVFSRGANGTLTVNECVENTGGSECTLSGTERPGLKAAAAVGVAPDGLSVYVAAGRQQRRR